MTIHKLLTVCLLAAGLCLAGSAQAFCFMKGKQSARGMDHYSYPLPPIALAPSRFHAYPYGVLPTKVRQVHSGYLPAQQDSLLIRLQDSH